MVPIIGLLALTAGVATVQLVSTQEVIGQPEIEKADMLDPQAAWLELQQTAQERLNAAEDQTTVARKIFSELANFAKTYPGTDEAAYAWLNHASLATQLGDPETTETSLRQALKETRDPRLIREIHMQLAQVSSRY